MHDRKYVLIPRWHDFVEFKSTHSPIQKIFWTIIKRLDKRNININYNHILHMIIVYTVFIKTKCQHKMEWNHLYLIRFVADSLGGKAN